MNRTREKRGHFVACAASGLWMRALAVTERTGYSRLLYGLSAWQRSRRGENRPRNTGPTMVRPKGKGIVHADVTLGVLRVARPWRSS